MTDDTIRRYSLAEINAMRAEELAELTPADAPEIEPDEGFWRVAKIVQAAPPPQVGAKGNEPTE